MNRRAVRGGGQQPGRPPRGDGSCRGKTAAWPPRTGPCSMMSSPAVRRVRHPVDRDGDRDRCHPETRPAAPRGDRAAAVRRAGEAGHRATLPLGPHVRRPSTPANGVPGEGPAAAVQDGAPNAPAELVDRTVSSVRELEALTAESTAAGAPAEPWKTGTRAASGSSPRRSAGPRATTPASRASSTSTASWPPSAGTSSAAHELGDGARVPRCIPARENRRVPGETRFRDCADARSPRIRIPQRHRRRTLEAAAAHLPALAPVVRRRPSTTGAHAPS